MKLSPDGVFEGCEAEVCCFCIHTPSQTPCCVGFLVGDIMSVLYRTLPVIFYSDRQSLWTHGAKGGRKMPAYVRSQLQSPGDFPPHPHAGMCYPTMVVAVALLLCSATVQLAWSYWHGYAFTRCMATCITLKTSLTCCVA